MGGTTDRPGQGAATALVLAGSRGPGDPVARAAGVGHKALAPVAGRPMILRVLDALEQSGEVGPIAVVIEAGADLSSVPELATMFDEGRLLRFDAASGPAASVAEALKRLDTQAPVLVTTADHPLLSPQMIAEVLRGAPREAAVTVAVTPAEVVRGCYPGSVRTFYRFGKDAVSGCNLFVLRGHEARRAVAFWQTIEGARKRPWRMVAALGPVTLAAFLAGRLSLEGALARLSRRLGVPLGVVRLAIAEAAIDVDRPEDLALVERILTEREAGDGASRRSGD
ncbi:MAG: nucleotidyltransferase family protein [Rhodovibrionaceae bacterium]|nr:nucleotidyltransferase family protein [Rhodovibrionaceae bacterium]